MDRRNVLWNIFSGVVAVVTFGLVKPAKAESQRREKRVLHVDELEVGFGNYRVTIKGMEGDQGAGIWINKYGQPFPSIAVFYGKSAASPFIGLCGRDFTHGCAIALGLDKDDQPFIQMVAPDGECRRIGFHSLLLSTQNTWSERWGDKT